MTVTSRRGATSARAERRCQPTMPAFIFAMPWAMVVTGAASMGFTGTPGLMAPALELPPASEPAAVALNAVAPPPAAPRCSWEELDAAMPSSSLTTTASSSSSSTTATASSSSPTRARFAAFPLAAAAALELSSVARGRLASNVDVPPVEALPLLLP